MKSNGVKHITSAPYHPATNGFAERSVQTFKQALRSMEESSKPIEEKLAKFLITYRNTPHSTTGESSAQLMLGRPIRTRLDLVKPNLNRKMVQWRRGRRARGGGHGPPIVETRRKIVNVVGNCRKIVNVVGNCQSCRRGGGGGEI
jgi:hypothetical protein